MHVHKLRLEERRIGKKGEFLPWSTTSFLDSSPKWLLHVVDRNNAKMLFVQFQYESPSRIEIFLPFWIRDPNNMLSVFVFKLFERSIE